MKGKDDRLIGVKGQKRIAAFSFFAGRRLFIADISKRCQTAEDHGKVSKTGFDVRAWELINGNEAKAFEPSGGQGSRPARKKWGG